MRSLSFVGDVAFWIGVLAGAALGGSLVWVSLGRALAAARARAHAAEAELDSCRRELDQVSVESMRLFDELSGSLGDVAEQARRTLGLRVAADESLAARLRSLDGGGGEGPEPVSLTSAQTASAELSHHARSVEQSLADLERRSELIGQLLENTTAEVRMADHKGDDLVAAAGQAVDAASAIDEVIRKLQSTATDTAELSTQVSTEAERGYRAVHRTLDQIERIRELTNVARARIEALGERVADIGHVVKVIHDITEKTNLLALNASIIAAQAGEHGRSFAVVAREIKALAQRTAASTKEISVQIRSVQEESERATSAMVDGVAAVDEGFQVAIAAGDALDAIRQTARAAQKRVQSMTRTLRQQFSAAQQVVDSAAMVSERAASFASSVRGQSSTAEQLRAGARDVQESASQLSELLREHSARAHGYTELLSQAAAQLITLRERDGELRSRLDELRSGAETARNYNDELAAQWALISKTTTRLRQR